MGRISIGHSAAFGNPHIIGSKPLTVGDILVNSAAIVSPGTTCWLASAPAHHGGSDLPNLVLKKAWQYSQPSNEAELLKLLSGAWVKGIAVLYCCDGGNKQSTVHSILGKCLPGAVALDLDWKAKKHR